MPDPSHSRYTNLIPFLKRCVASGFAPIMVPADGDCLAWSLRCFHLGWNCSGDWESRTAKSQVATIRKMIAAAWEERKSECELQELFVHFNPDNFRPPADQEPRTPSPRAAAEPAEFTPPHPEQIPQAQKAGQAKHVPLAEKQNPASPALRRPTKRTRRNPFGEPAQPDMEEAYHKAMMAENEQILDFSRVDDIGEEHFEGVDKISFDSRPQRKYNAREWKCRPKTQGEVDQLSLHHWLAGKGLTYESHCFYHREDDETGSGRHCGFGGWRDFKKALLNDRDAFEWKCTTCAKACKHLGVSVDEVDAVLQQGPGEKPVVPEIMPMPKEPSDAAAKKPRGKARDEYDDCVAYVQKFQEEVELVEGPARQWLKYRCLVCRTKRQKQGKLNKLGRPVLRETVHYLHQHLDSAEHKKRKNAAAAANVPPDPAEEMVKCSGVLVSDPNGKTILHWHFPEFKIWSSFFDLKKRVVKNEYSSIMSNGQFTVKHHQCPGEYLPSSSRGRNCCAACWRLTGPKSVTKTLVRFGRKYYAALLLQKKLFEPEQAVADFLLEMKGKSWAKRHAKMWEDIVNKSNSDLQKTVRDEWVSDTQGGRTGVCEAFYSSVVLPSISVHVGSIASNVTCLAQKFVDALQGNQLDASWLSAGE